MPEDSGPAPLRTLFAVLAACACLAVAPRFAAATNSLPGSLVIGDKGGGSYAFTWGTVDAPSLGSNCTANPGFPRTVYTLCYRRVLFNGSLAADQDNNGGFAGGGCSVIVSELGTKYGPLVIADGSMCADVGAIATNSGICPAGSVCGNCAPAPVVSYSGTSCHSFVHPAADPNDNLLVDYPLVGRADSTGGQLGFGQQWTFSYALDNDATTTLKVFGPGVTFPAADANQNFTDQPTFAAAHPTCTYVPPPAINSAATNSGPDCPIKTLVDQIARPGENFFTSLNTEVWDLRDSSGSVVPNGTYSLWGSFTDVRDNGAVTAPNDQSGTHVYCPPNCPSNTLGYRGFLTDVPVDVLRILNLKTVGITQAGQKASITYDITGNASVREAIAQPSTRFMIDSAGNCGTAGLIQAEAVYCKTTSDGTCAGFAPMTPLPGPICENPNSPFHGLAHTADTNPLIVSTLTFNHSSGVGITDFWDGSVYEKTQVSTPGVYNLAISAMDGYGNRAVDANGNDGPILATLIYDVTPTPPTPDTTPPTIKDVIVHCTNGDQDLGGTPLFNVKTCAYPGAFTGATVIVSHERSGEILGTTTVGVTGPSGAVAPAAGSPSNDGVSTITFNAGSAAATAGNYTITYNICDQSNNCTNTSQGAPVATFVVGAAAALPPPGVSAVTVGNTSISSGTSVGPFSSIFFNLATTTGTTAGTGANLSAVTVYFGGTNLGGSVSASGQTVTWSTDTVSFATGTYYAAITPKDSNGTVGVQYSLPFVIPAQPPPTISTITVGAAQIPLGRTVTPFSSLNFVLVPAPGNLASANTVVSVKYNGTLDLGGRVSVSGNTVQWSTTTAVSSTGTYTVLVVPQDSAGNTAAAYGLTFTMLPPVVPTVSAIAVGGAGVALSGGPSVVNTLSFTSISFALATTTGATAGTGVNLSTVTVTFGPTNILVPGSVSASGLVVTWTAAAAVSSTGTYNVTIIPRDTAGTAGASQTATFVLAAPAGGTTMTADAFKASVKPYPNPSSAAPMKINFQVANNASVDFDIYTLSGKRVYHATQSYAAGQQTFNWNMINTSGSAVASGVYLLRITANDGTNVLKASKKVMILR